EEGAELRAGDSLVAHRLIKKQRIGDAPACEGIDHEPLLIGGNDLLRCGVEIEQPLVEVADVLNERDLEVQTRRCDEPLGLTKFENQSLLRLIHGEECQIGRHCQKAKDDENHGESGASHY